MGGDGGSIPGRADVVRVKGYGFKRNLGGMGYDPNTLVLVGDGRLSDVERRDLGFTRCRISADVFTLPIVADRYGNLYSKEHVLKCMVEKSLPSDLKHLKKTKDLKQIAPTRTKTASAFEVWNDKTRRLQCPVTGREATGKSDFLVNWSCGCVFSKKAFDELREAKCPVCGSSDMELVELVPRHPASNSPNSPPAKKQKK